MDKLFVIVFGLLIHFDYWIFLIPCLILESISTLMIVMYGTVGRVIMTPFQVFFNIFVRLILFGIALTSEGSNITTVVLGLSALALCFYLFAMSLKFFNESEQS
jgi:hypothetical protein